MKSQTRLDETSLRADPLISSLLVLSQKPAAASRADGTASNGRQDYGNSFAALEQEEDSFEPEAPSAPAAPQVSTHALAQAAAEAQREELKQVKWMYKDPSGAIQGELELLSFPHLRRDFKNRTFELT